MRQSHLLIYNTAIIWTTRMLRIVPELILVPFLIRSIGESGYGVYALAWSLMVSIEMLEMGLQSGVIKHSAALMAQKRIVEVNKVISTSFVHSIIFGIIAGGAIIAATPLLSGQAAGLAFSFVTVGIMVLLVVPLSPYVGIVLSQQRHYVNAIAGTASKYVNLLAVILWYKLVGPSVESLIVISAGAIILAKLVQVPIAYRLIPGLRNRLNLFDWRTFKMLMSFGVMIVLCTLCSVVKSTGVRWLMGFLVSTSFVAHLVIILMPSLLLSQIVQAMTSTIMPAASKYEAVKDYRMLKELLIRGIRYSSIVVLTAVIVATLATKNILEVWVGPEYKFLGLYTLVIFCSVAFQMSSSCAHHMLRGMGKLKISLIASVVGLVIVPIGTILVTWLIWREPYVAVTAGIALGNVVYGFMQTVFCIKAVKSSYRGLFMRAYGGAMIVAMPVCVLALAIVTYAGIESLMGRMCISTLAVLFFIAGFYLLFSTAAERGQLKECYQVVLDRTVSLRRKLLRRK